MFCVCIVTIAFTGGFPFSRLREPHVREHGFVLKIRVRRVRRAFVPIVRRVFRATTVRMLNYGRNRGRLYAQRTIKKRLSHSHHL